MSNTTAFWNRVAAGMSCALIAMVTSSTAPGQTLTNSEPGSPAAINEKQALEISQAAIGRQVGDYTFRDTDGRRVKISDFQGAPLVISMVYSSCADVCPIITKTLDDADAIARDALGDDAYTILTVGFDVSADNPVRMKSFARQNGVPVGEHWLFVSGDLLSIHALAEDMGFQFFESPKGFDHLTQTTILDGEGRVYRQIYGEAFETPHLVEPLKALVFGTTSPFSSLNDLINKVRLFCTIYDPAADRYRFEYAIFFRIFVGGMIILGMMAFIGKWLWQNRKSVRQDTHKKNTVKGLSC